jgi:hypothetical protein
MSLITFIQIGGTIRNGTPALFPPVRRAKIQFAIGLSYFSVKDTESRTYPLYDFYSPVTIVMVHEGSLKAYAEGYAEVKDKVIIVFASTKASRDFNLGMAVGASSMLKPGTYIAAGGKVMHWQEYNPASW